LLLVTGMSGLLNNAPTDLARVYAFIMILFTWLTTVWLLRAIMAGQKPKLRDGLYSAGAPVLSTMIVTTVLIIQLLPIALAALAVAAAIPSGLLDNGVEAMVFWVVVALLVSLSLYWIASSMIALVVVTLPGMYPMRALTTSGDLVIGRRLRLIWRILWLMFTIVLGWVAVMLPVILLDTWLKGVWPAIAWLPIVPVALLIMSSLSAVWSSAYTYVLYRKVVDDDTAPA